MNDEKEENKHKKRKNMVIIKRREEEEENKGEEVEDTGSGRTIRGGEEKVREKKTKNEIRELITFLFFHVISTSVLQCRKPPLKKTDLS